MKASLLIGLGVFLFTGVSAFAQVVVTVDENGNGSVTTSAGQQPLPATVAVDPTWGGATLSYFSPSANVVPGDLLILEPTSPTNVQSSDLIRFLRVPGTAGSQLFFYSDVEAGETNKSVADVGLPPNVGSTAIGPFVTFTETGLEAGPNGFIYTPGPNDPGYFPINTAGAGPTYNIISDTPEPASAAFLLGAAGLLTLGRRRAAHRD
jgi:hypothetical protein